MRRKGWLYYMQNETKEGSVLFRSDIDYNILEQVTHKKGVWALFGKEKNNPYVYKCLNVGKSTDVGNEIEYDIRCLNDDKNISDGDREYINQFGEDCNFKYAQGMTQEYLYPYIFNNYKDFVFFLILSESNDQKYERKFAWWSRAIFWRNGRPYQKPKVGLYNTIKSIIIGEDLEKYKYIETSDIEELSKKIAGFKKYY